VDVFIEVLSPLRECFMHSEVVCVRECCGIGAISTDAELIGAWARDVGPSAVSVALRQLAELMTVVEDRTHKVSSLFLNHYTCHESARLELLDFLKAFRDGLESSATPETSAC
jgi:hypothetical protein